MNKTEKRGRLKLKDPRTHSYRIRLNEREWEDLHKLIKSGVNVSELIRLFITMEANKKE